MAKATLKPRLLTVAQAAAYCGVSSKTFLRICPVPAISLGADARLRRFDIEELDRWIESLRKGTANDNAGEWLERIT